MSEKDGSIADFGSANKKSGDPISKMFMRMEKGLDIEEGMEDEKGKSKLSQWSQFGHDSYIAVGNTFKKLKSGVYDIETDRQSGQSVFVEKHISVDDVLNFPDSKCDKILREMDDFWNRSKIFKEYGFLHRRGYLLYGPPGSGKTVLVQQVIKKIVDQGGIVFICKNPSTFSMGLSIFREIEPNRQIVCIFEDIEAIITDYGDDALLSLLDGENQIDKVLNIATTNYPEELDKRIIARPRRFDRVIKIGMPGAKIRRIYFEKKLKIKKDELEKWVKDSMGFSFAAMAELVISVKCLGNEFEKAIEILKDLMNSKKSSDEDKNPMGYGVGFGSATADEEED